MGEKSGGGRIVPVSCMLKGSSLLSLSIEAKPSASPVVGVVKVKVMSWVPWPSTVPESASAVKAPSGSELMSMA